MLFLGINIAVVNWVIGSNLKGFWFLHLATVLILLGLFFCRRRKKKAFHFSGFLWVGGFNLAVREVGVRVPIDFSGACSTRPQKNVLPSVWEQTAGGRRLAKKCLASFSVGDGALRQFVLWLARFWAASVKNTDAQWLGTSCTSRFGAYVPIYEQLLWEPFSSSCLQGSAAMFISCKWKNYSKALAPNLSCAVWTTWSPWVGGLLWMCNGGSWVWEAKSSTSCVLTAGK